jgi:hypothetical protein
MSGQLTYLRAQERVADLQRAADQQRLVRVTKRRHPLRHERSSVARLRANSWSRLLQRSSRTTFREPADDSRPRTDVPEAAEALFARRGR